MREKLIPVLYGIQVNEKVLFRKVISVRSVPQIGATLDLLSICELKVVSVQQNLNAYLGLETEHFETVVAKFDDIIGSEEIATIDKLTRNGWTKIEQR